MTEELLPIMLGALLAVWLYVTLVFLISRALKRNDVADVAWGPGILLVALVSFAYHESTSLIVLLLTLLAGIWGLRLGIRIFFKNLKKKEDRRYVALSEAWGRWTFIRSYTEVFLLQGALMILIGMPFIVASTFAGTATPHPFFLYIGLSVWLIGFFFESVADYQLDRFLGKEENRGNIMRYGLWKYSRHPNYFGEVTMWWGVFLIVFPLPFSLLSLISPLTITFLILKISGVPLLEKQFANNPEFQEYQRTTNAFFPWFPRK